MRKMVSGFVGVRAIGGTRVVLLEFDIKEADAKGPIGFVFQRNGPSCCAITSLLN